MADDPGDLDDRRLDLAAVATDLHLCQHATSVSSQIWVQWQDPSFRAHNFGDIALPTPQEMRRLTRPGGELVRSEREWEAIRAENEARRAERDRLASAARAQARRLLELVLNREQLASYDRHAYFDVHGSAGGLFRIHHGTSGNIRQLVDGIEVNRLCVHPTLHDGPGYLPTEDCLVAQALALMHDELGAVGLANVHQGVRHQDGHRHEALQKNEELFREEQLILLMYSVVS